MTLSQCRVPALKPLSQEGHGALSSALSSAWQRWALSMNGEPHLRVVCVKKADGTWRRTQRGLRAALQRRTRLKGR